MKFMPIVFITLTAAFAAAAPSVYCDVYCFGSEGVIWDAEGWVERILDDNRVVEWNHSLPYSGDISDITSAKLIIEGCGIENVLGYLKNDPYEGLDNVSVYFEGVYLGNLEGNVTCFDLDKSLLSDPMAAKAQIDFVFDCPLDELFPIDVVALTQSTLCISVVPAPGAVLLCTVGTMAVGYLRRRNRF